jgi:hypothetical protein
MTVKHAHVELAEVQKEQGTMLCPGPCPHRFNGRQANREVYGEVTSGEVFDYYETLMGLTNMTDRKDRRVKASILAAVERYTKMMLDIWVKACGIRTFKDQDGVYQGWGPPGDFLMMRIVEHVRRLKDETGLRIIYQHDNKRGDLAATMMGYYDRFLGDLMETLEIPHSYYGYDTMNIHVYMGKDVVMLEESRKKNVIPAQGLKLMREKGKAIVLVDFTSNDSQGDYQNLVVPERDGKTVAQCVAEDAYTWSQKYGLEYKGLSALGLVVGCTKRSNGVIRSLFPTATHWVPGFGNQQGGFPNYMPELIRDPDSEWNGQGAIFGDETSKMYCWMEKFGGTGKVADAEKCSRKAVLAFRKDEFEAFQVSDVIEAGIRYPFKYNEAA